MADEVVVTGLAETIKALRALPTAISGKSGGPLRKALYQAAKVIRAEAIQLAPDDTGLLKKSIAMFRDRAPQNIGANEHYTIGVRKLRRKYADTQRNRGKGRVGKSYTLAGAAYYARFLEFGTSKMAAHPFFRPAFEAKKVEAVRAFETSLAAQVDKAVEAAKRGGQ